MNFCCMDPTNVQSYLGYHYGQKWNGVHVCLCGVVRNNFCPNILCKLFIPIARINSETNGTESMGYKML